MDASAYVLIDSEERKNDEKIKKIIYNCQKYGIELKGANYQPTGKDNLERIMNAVSFADSYTSPGIQLADVCSRVIWGHFEKGMNGRYEQLSKIFDRVGDRVYEPSISPLEGDWT